jgi:hypothetical protein
MNDVSQEARDLVQKFVIRNNSTLAGVPSVLPAATIILVEAFALASAMYAIETDSSLDNGIGAMESVVSDIGARVAKECHKYLKDAKAEAKTKAQAKAKTTTAEILARLQK